MGTGLNNGTLPETVELSFTLSLVGDTLVHRITEFG